MMQLMSFVAGVAIVGALVMFVLYFRPAPPRPASTKPSLMARWKRTDKKTKNRLIGGLALGVVLAFVTGFPVLVVVVPAVLVIVPALLGKPSTYERDLIFALETWARSLAGTANTGSYTLRQVIGISQGSVPQMLKAPVTRLYLRMSSTWSAADALEAFADELDNVYADEVVVYLIQAAEFNAGGLHKALTSVADGLSVTAKDRLATESERAKPRGAMIWMTVIMASGIAVLIYQSRSSQMDLYRTPQGGILLAVVLCVFLALLVWARKITRVAPEPRLLRSRTQQGESS